MAKSVPDNELHSQSKDWLVEKVKRLRENTRRLEASQARIGKMWYEAYSQLDRVKEFMRKELSE